MRFVVEASGFFGCERGKKLTGNGPSPLLVTIVTGMDAISSEGVAPDVDFPDADAEELPPRVLLLSDSEEDTYGAPPADPVLEFEDVFEDHLRRRGFGKVGSACGRIRSTMRVWEVGVESEMEM